MQGDNPKPKVRLTRNADGSIGTPSKANKHQDLAKAWEAQKVALNAPDESVTKEVKQAIGVATNKAKEKAINAANKLPVSSSDDGKDVVVRIPKASVSKPAKFILKPLTLGLIITLIGVFIVVGLYLNHNKTKKADNNQTNQINSGNIPTNVTPEFPVLTPFGNGVADLGGFAKISPAGSPPVYAYTDSIGGVKIKVSQQVIPDALREDRANKIKTLAQSFNATEELSVGDEIAYIGTSAKGPQSVVYLKGENLVLIAADSVISNADWVEYIGSLKY